MKKITICLSAFCMSLQYASAQISIMPEVGVNLSNISAKDNYGGATETYDNKIGFKLGASFMIPVSKSFFVQPGLFVNTKGARYSYEDTYQGFTYTSKATINANYLEMPLNVGYINDMGKAGSLFLTAGPYFGFGLSGKVTVKEYLNGVLVPSGNDNADLFGDDGVMKRFDLGLNFGIGYKLPVGVFARVQYGTSLTNISSDSDYSVRNKGFSFSAGYVFTFNKATKSKVRTGTSK